MCLFGLKYVEFVGGNVTFDKEYLPVYNDHSSAEYQNLAKTFTSEVCFVDLITSRRFHQTFPNLGLVIGLRTSIQRRRTHRTHPKLLVLTQDTIGLILAFREIGCQSP